MPYFLENTVSQEILRGSLKELCLRRTLMHEWILPKTVTEYVQ